MSLRRRELYVLGSDMPNIQRRLSAILCADVVSYSRLVGSDEEGILTAVKSLLTEVIEPELVQHRGRLVKTTGDGLLVEFASVVDATRCAVAIQSRMAQRNATVTRDRRIDWRIGINSGDVVIDDGDIFGDAVNIASRIESMTEPGGICLSGQAHDQVFGKLSCRFRALGSRQLKNIAQPVEVFAAVLDDDGRNPDLRRPLPESSQGPVLYCRAQDGVRLAYRIVGEGPPIVRTGTFLTHVEHDWACYSHIWGGLARTHTLLRYDARGNGASDWDVPELSFDLWLSDLETVVDAAGLDRFVLFGMSQGVGLSIAYAVKHPERVSRLILVGGFGVGALAGVNEETRQKWEAMMTLARLGWDDPNSAFRQMFTSRFLPDLTSEQAAAYTDLLGKVASAEGAARYMTASGEMNVKHLWTKVPVPALVRRSRDDAVCLAEPCREMARTIPNARYVALEGRNHIFTATEAASERFFEEIELFLSE
jgi:class 3 adenylate cyclase/pimeloyl-ACP methyl ester carboxylesterase